MLPVRKNMSARRMPNKALLALSALALSSLVQAYICTLSTTSMMASAAGPTLRPIPESTQKPVSEKPKAEKEAAKVGAAERAPVESEGVVITGQSAARKGFTARKTTGGVGERTRAAKEAQEIAKKKRKMLIEEEEMELEEEGATAERAADFEAEVEQVEEQ